MKKTLTILNFVILTLLYNGCKQKDCTKFKLGHFLIKGDEKTLDNYSIRTDSTEIIYNDSIGFSDKFKINWTNECEYYMILQKTNNPKLMQITPVDTIFIQILETTSNEFKYKGKVKGREYFGEQYLKKPRTRTF